MTTQTSRHPVFTQSEDIAEICKPLQLLNINYFSHGHVDSNGQFTAICNNPQFADLYIKNKFYQADIHMSKERLGNIIIWDSLDWKGESKKLNEIATTFGINHTFSICESTANGFDYYNFSSNSISHSINQEFLRNLGLLKLFILNFRDKVFNSSLVKAYDFKFKIDKENNLYNCDRFKNDKSDRNKFLNMLNIKSDINKNLTMRELEVLSWLQKGKTLDQIAAILNLSEITVKKHIARTKEKTGCINLFQLGEYFSRFVIT